jgi:hypothetical protein
MLKPDLLRTGGAGHDEGGCVLESGDSAAVILINHASAGSLGAQSDRFPRGGTIHGGDGNLVIHSAREYARQFGIQSAARAAEDSGSAGRLVTAIVAVASGLAARSAVTAGTTPAR